MTRNVICYLLIFCNYAFAKAQLNHPSVTIQQDSIQTPDYFYIDGDSLNTIELDRVMLIQSLSFDSKYEQIRYQIIKRKVQKVWPYAKMAAERITILNDRLNSLKYESDKKRYTKIVQRYVEEEFTEELKKLSRTEGQLLIKLIHRQTGQTSYDLLKQLRSGWSAFWFDNTASLFDLDLKATYNPESVVTDFYTEDALMQLFKNDLITDQEPAIDIDYTAGRSMFKKYEQQLPTDYDSIQLAQRAIKRKAYLAKKAKENTKKQKKLMRKRRRASKK